MDDEIDFKFNKAIEENQDIPTIISHEKDIKGETVIKYGSAQEEVKLIEAQELEIKSIRGCLLGG